MISEVDIRDWDKVDFKAMEDAVCTFHEFYEYPVLMDFLRQVELIRDKQIKQVAALLRKKEE